MGTKMFFRFFGAFLATVYTFTNCLFAHKPETSFWEERRQSARQNSSQYVSLVTNVNAPVPAPLSKQLPVFNLKEHQQFGFNLGSLQTYGSLRSRIPIKARKNQSVVLHIQDVHMNLEAQTNIGAAVTEVIKTNSGGLIALEGIFGNVDLTRFNDFPHQSGLKKISDYLLKENEISGPVRAILAGGEKAKAFDVAGVDDAEHYQANVAAYVEAAKSAESLKVKLAETTGELKKAKQQEFNAGLLAFDATVEDYRAGKISLGDYAKVLNHGSSIRTPQADLFLQALAIESNLNYAQVEKERARVLEGLLSRLNQTESSELMAASMAYRMGDVSHSGFYSYLRTLCSKKKLSLSQFPALDAYLNYVTVSQAIQADQLFKDIQILETSAYEALAKTPAEKKLVEESKKAYLTGKLLDFALTSQEWVEYKSLKSQIPNSRLQTNSNTQKEEDFRFVGNLEFEPLDLSSFERFYEEAEIRDEKISENVKRLAQDPKRLTVLVTGGFHSNGIEDRLSKEGFAVAQFTPKITKVEDLNGSAYLSVFNQEKTPLEKMFRGEKLFLARDPVKGVFKAAAGLSAVFDPETENLAGLLPGFRGRSLIKVEEKENGSRQAVVGVTRNPSSNEVLVFNVGWSGALADVTIIETPRKENWYQRITQTKLSVGKVKEALAGIRGNLNEINSRLMPAQKIEAGSMGGRMIANYEEAVRYFNRIRNQIFSPAKLVKIFRRINSLLIQGEMFDQSGTAFNGAGVHQIFTWALEDEFQGLIEKGPALAVSELFFRLVKAQDGIDGNGRAALFMVNLVLVKMGYSPIIINKENVVSFRGIRYRGEPDRYGNSGRGESGKEAVDFFNRQIEKAFAPRVSPRPNSIRYYWDRLNGVDEVKSVRRALNWIWAEAAVLGVFPFAVAVVSFSLVFTGVIGRVAAVSLVAATLAGMTIFVFWFTGYHVRLHRRLLQRENSVRGPTEQTPVPAAFNSFLHFFLGFAHYLIFYFVIAGITTLLWLDSYLLNSSINYLNPILFVMACGLVVAVAWHLVGDLRELTSGHNLMFRRDIGRTEGVFSTWGITVWITALIRNGVMSKLLKWPKSPRQHILELAVHRFSIVIQPLFVFSMFLVCEFVFHPLVGVWATLGASFILVTIYSLWHSTRVVELPFGRYGVKWIGDGSSPYLVMREFISYWIVGFLSHLPLFGSVLAIPFGHYVIYPMLVLCFIFAVLMQLKYRRLPAIGVKKDLRGFRGKIKKMIARTKRIEDPSERRVAMAQAIFLFLYDLDRHLDNPEFDKDDLIESLCLELWMSKEERPAFILAMSRDWGLFSLSSFFLEIFSKGLFDLKEENLARAFAFIVVSLLESKSLHGENYEFARKSLAEKLQELADLMPQAYQSVLNFPYEDEATLKSLFEGEEYRDKKTLRQILEKVGVALPDPSSLTSNFFLSKTLKQKNGNFPFYTLPQSVVLFFLTVASAMLLVWFIDLAFYQSVLSGGVWRSAVLIAGVLVLGWSFATWGLLFAGSVIALAPPESTLFHWLGLRAPTVEDRSAFIRGARERGYAVSLGDYRTVGSGSLIRPSRDKDLIYLLDVFSVPWGRQAGWADLFRRFLLIVFLESASVHQKITPFGLFKGRQRWLNPFVRLANGLRSSELFGYLLMPFAFVLRGRLERVVRYQDRQTPTAPPELNSNPLPLGELNALIDALKLNVSPKQPITPYLIRSLHTVARAEFSPDDFADLPYMPGEHAGEDPSQRVGTLRLRIKELLTAFLIHNNPIVVVSIVTGVMQRKKDLDETVLERFNQAMEAIQTNHSKSTQIDLTLVQCLYFLAKTPPDNLPKPVRKAVNAHLTWWLKEVRHVTITTAIILGLSENPVANHLNIRMGELSTAGDKFFQHLRQSQPSAAMSKIIAAKNPDKPAANMPPGKAPSVEEQLNNRVSYSKQRPGQKIDYKKRVEALDPDKLHAVLEKEIGDRVRPGLKIKTVALYGSSIYMFRIPASDYDMYVLVEGDFQPAPPLKIDLPPEVFRNPLNGSTHKADIHVIGQKTVLTFTMMCVALYLTSIVLERGDEFEPYDDLPIKGPVSKLSVLVRTGNLIVEALDRLNKLGPTKGMDLYEEDPDFQPQAKAFRRMEEANMGLVHINPALGIDLRTAGYKLSNFLEYAEERLPRLTLANQLIGDALKILEKRDGADRVDFKAAHEKLLRAHNQLKRVLVSSDPTFREKLWGALELVAAAQDAVQRAEKPFSLEVVVGDIEEDPLDILFELEDASLFERSDAEHLARLIASLRDVQQAIQSDPVFPAFVEIQHRLQERIDLLRLQIERGKFVLLQEFLLGKMAEHDNVGKKMDEERAAEDLPPAQRDFKSLLNGLWGAAIIILLFTLGLAAAGFHSQMVSLAEASFFVASFFGSMRVLVSLSLQEFRDGFIPRERPVPAPNSIHYLNLRLKGVEESEARARGLKAMWWEAAVLAGGPILMIVTVSLLASFGIVSIAGAALVIMAISAAAFAGLVWFTRHHVRVHKRIVEKENAERAQRREKPLPPLNYYFLSFALGFIVYFFFYAAAFAAAFIVWAQGSSLDQFPVLLFLIGSVVLGALGVRLHRSMDEKALIPERLSQMMSVARALGAVGLLDYMDENEGKGPTVVKTSPVPAPAKPSRRELKRQRRMEEDRRTHERKKGDEPVSPTAPPEETRLPVQPIVAPIMDVPPPVVVAPELEASAEIIDEPRPVFVPVEPIGETGLGIRGDDVINMTTGETVKPLGETESYLTPDGRYVDILGDFADVRSRVILAHGKVYSRPSGYEIFPIPGTPFYGTMKGFVTVEDLPVQANGLILWRGDYFDSVFAEKAERIPDSDLLLVGGRVIREQTGAEVDEIGGLGLYPTGGTFVELDGTKVTKGPAGLVKLGSRVFDSSTWEEVFSFGIDVELYRTRDGVMDWNGKKAEQIPGLDAFVLHDGQILDADTGRFSETIAGGKAFLYQGKPYDKDGVLLTLWPPHAFLKLADKTVVSAISGELIPVHGESGHYISGTDFIGPNGEAAAKLPNAKFFTAGGKVFRQSDGNRPQEFGVSGFYLSESGHYYNRHDEQGFILPGSELILSTKDAKQWAYSGRVAGLVAKEWGGDSELFLSDDNSYYSLHGRATVVGNLVRRADGKVFNKKGVLLLEIASSGIYADGEDFWDENLKPVVKLPTRSNLLKKFNGSIYDRQGNAGVAVGPIWLLKGHYYDSLGRHLQKVRGKDLVFLPIKNQRTKGEKAYNTSDGSDASRLGETHFFLVKSGEYVATDGTTGSLIENTPYVRDSNGKMFRIEDGEEVEDGTLIFIKDRGYFDYAMRPAKPILNRGVNETGLLIVTETGRVYDANDGSPFSPLGESGFYRVKNRYFNAEGHEGQIMEDPNFIQNLETMEVVALERELLVELPGIPLFTITRSGEFRNRNGVVMNWRLDQLPELINVWKKYKENQSRIWRIIERLILDHRDRERHRIEKMLEPVKEDPIGIRSLALLGRGTPPVTRTTPLGPAAIAPSATTPSSSSPASATAGTRHWSRRPPAVPDTTPLSEFERHILNTIIEWFGTEPDERQPKSELIADLMEWRNQYGQNASAVLRRLAEPRFGIDAADVPLIFAELDDQFIYQILRLNEVQRPLPPETPVSIRYYWDRLNGLDVDPAARRAIAGLWVEAAVLAGMPLILSATIIQLVVHEIITPVTGVGYVAAFSFGFILSLALFAEYHVKLYMRLFKKENAQRGPPGRQNWSVVTSRAEARSYMWAGFAPYFALYLLLLIPALVFTVNPALLNFNGASLFVLFWVSLVTQMAFLAVAWHRIIDGKQLPLADQGKEKRARASVFALLNLVNSIVQFGVIFLCSISPIWSTPSNNLIIFLATLIFVRGAGYWLIQKLFLDEEFNLSWEGFSISLTFFIAAFPFFLPYMLGPSVPLLPYFLLNALIQIYHDDWKFRSTLRQKEQYSWNALDSLQKLFGRAVAVLFLPAALAVIGVLGIMIALSSKGPIFYSQERVGYQRKIFKVYKLRTYTDAKSLEEKSLTPLGALISPIGLDEAPQIFPLLMGQMQWFGPRPHQAHELPDDYSILDETGPGFFGRYAAKTHASTNARIGVPEEAKQDELGDFRNRSLIYNTVLFFVCVLSSMLGFGLAILNKKMQPVTAVPGEKQPLPNSIRYYLDRLNGVEEATAMRNGLTWMWGEAAVFAGVPMVISVASMVLAFNGVLSYSAALGVMFVTFLVAAVALLRFTAVHVKLQRALEEKEKRTALSSPLAWARFLNGFKLYFFFYFAGFFVSSIARNFAFTLNVAGLVGVIVAIVFFALAAAIQHWGHDEKEFDRLKSARIKKINGLMDDVINLMSTEEKTGKLNGVRKIAELSGEKDFFVDRGIAYLPARKGKLTVVGDLHGDITALEQTLKNAGYDEEGNAVSADPDYLVFVGDYIDVGARSLDVVERVLSIKKKDPKHVVLLSGNHDVHELKDDSPAVAANGWVKWFFKIVERDYGYEGRVLARRWYRFGNELPQLLVTANGLAVFHAAPPSVLAPAWKEDPGLGTLAAHFELRMNLNYGLVKTDGSLPTDHANVAGAKPFNKEMDELTQETGHLVYWVGAEGVRAFLEGIGARIIIRGHDRMGPLYSIFDGAFLTVIGTDHRSPDYGYQPGDKIIARSAEIDLAKIYEVIDARKVVKPVWDESVSKVEGPKQNNFFADLFRSEAVRTTLVSLLPILFAIAGSVSGLPTAMGMAVGGTIGLTAGLLLLVVVRFAQRTKSWGLYRPTDLMVAISLVGLYIGEKPFGVLGVYGPWCHTLLLVAAGFAIAYFTLKETSEYQREKRIANNGRYYLNHPLSWTLWLFFLVVVVDILSKILLATLFPGTVFFHLTPSHRLIRYVIIFTVLLLLSMKTRIPASLILFIGGILGNQIEKYIWAGVIDPIPFIFSWPNLADFFIVFGAVLFGADLRYFFQSLSYSDSTWDGLKIEAGKEPYRKGFALFWLPLVLAVSLVAYPFFMRGQGALPPVPHVANGNISFQSTLPISQATAEEKVERLNRLMWARIVNAEGEAFQKDREWFEENPSETLRRIADLREKLKRVEPKKINDFGGSPNDIYEFAIGKALDGFERQITGKVSLDEASDRVLRTRMEQAVRETVLHELTLDPPDRASLRFHVNHLLLRYPTAVDEKGETEWFLRHPEKTATLIAAMKKEYRENHPAIVQNIEGRKINSIRTYFLLEKSIDADAMIYIRLMKFEKEVAMITDFLGRIKAGKQDDVLADMRASLPARVSETMKKVFEERWLRLGKGNMEEGAYLDFKDVWDVHLRGMIQRGAIPPIYAYWITNMAAKVGPRILEEQKKKEKAGRLPLKNPILLLVLLVGMATAAAALPLNSRRVLEKMPELQGVVEFGHATPVDLSTVLTPELAGYLDRAILLLAPRQQELVRLLQEFPGALFVTENTPRRMAVGSTDEAPVARGLFVSRVGGMLGGWRDNPDRNIFLPQEFRVKPDGGANLEDGYPIEISHPSNAAHESHVLWHGLNYGNALLEIVNGLASGFLNQVIWNKPNELPNVYLPFGLKRIVSLPVRGQDATLIDYFALTVLDHPQMGVNLRSYVGNRIDQRHPGASRKTTASLSGEERRAYAEEFIALYAPVQLLDVNQTSFRLHHIYDAIDKPWFFKTRESLIKGLGDFFARFAPGEKPFRYPKKNLSENGDFAKEFLLLNQRRINSAFVAFVQSIAAVYSPGWVVGGWYGRDAFYRWNIGVRNGRAVAHDFDSSVLPTSQTHDFSRDRFIAEFISDLGMLNAHLGHVANLLMIPAEVRLRAVARFMDLYRKAAKGASQRIFTRGEQTVLAPGYVRELRISARASWVMPLEIKDGLGLKAAPLLDIFQKNIPRRAPGALGILLPVAQRYGTAAVGRIEGIFWAATFTALSVALLFLLASVSPFALIAGAVSVVFLSKPFLRKIHRLFGVVVVDGSNSSGYSVNHELAIEAGDTAQLSFWAFPIILAAVLVLSWAPLLSLSAAAGSGLFAAGFAVAVVPHAKKNAAYEQYQVGRILAEAAIRKERGETFNAPGMNNLIRILLSDSMDEGSIATAFELKALAVGKADRFVELQRGYRDRLDEHYGGLPDNAGKFVVVTGRMSQGMTDSQLNDFIVEGFSRLAPGENGVLVLEREPNDQQALLINALKRRFTFDVAIQSNIGSVLRLSELEKNPVVRRALESMTQAAFVIQTDGIKIDTFGARTAMFRNPWLVLINEALEGTVLRLDQDQRLRNFVAVLLQA